MRARIEAALGWLRPSERRLADYVLAQPGEAIALSMAEIAGATGVSQPTVARFCAALGYSGFREFKIKLAQDIAGGVPFVHQDVRPGDSAAGIVGKVFDRSIATLMQARNNLSADAVERAVTILAGARRIEFYGAGNSGIVAQDLQHKFFRLGIPTVAYADPHVYAMSALTLAAGDAVVAVSNSGRTRDLLEAVENARDSGAAVVALTRSGSPLAGLATVALLADVAEDADVYTPMTSRITHLVVGDVLAVGVALRRGEGIAPCLERSKQAVHRRRVGTEGE